VSNRDAAHVLATNSSSRATASRNQSRHSGQSARASIPPGGVTPQSASHFLNRPLQASQGAGSQPVLRVPLGSASLTCKKMRRRKLFTTRSRAAGSMRPAPTVAIVANRIGGPRRILMMQSHAPCPPASTMSPGRAWIESRTRWRVRGPVHQELRSLVVCRPTMAFPLMISQRVLAARIVRSQHDDIARTSLRFLPSRDVLVRVSVAAVKPNSGNKRGRPD